MILVREWGFKLEKCEYTLAMRYAWFKFRVLRALTPVCFVFGFAAEKRCRRATKRVRSKFRFLYNNRMSDLTHVAPVRKVISCEDIPVPRAVRKMEARLRRGDFALAARYGECSQMY